ncbi:MAG: hypothetical protein OEQ29_08325 [Alphaproteobacteria bacterium]|nr:hypothetical protein [Alphaproteobacteria bacterium]
MAVFNTKKLLNRAGFHSFRPGIEPIGEASPRFLADLRRFQFAHDLIPDAAAQPGGPTVHMLTRTVFGTGDGRPPESETAFFRERFDKDPNRTLTGQPIFGEAGLDEAGAELIPARFGIPRGGGVRPRAPAKPRPKSDGDGGGDRKPPAGSAPPGGRGRPRPEREPSRKKERHEHEHREGPHEKEEFPAVGETPVHIFRYPNGRLYIAVNKKGEINLTRREPGTVSFEPVMNKAQIAGMRGAFNRNYPSLGDPTSFEERHKLRLESRVYGPAYDKKGKLTGFLPLRDPVTKRALRIPVGEAKILTDAQIRAMGLQKWQTSPKPAG